MTAEDAGTASDGQSMPTILVGPSGKLVFQPTSLTIPDGEGVRLETATYPNGTEFTLPADPATKLNVYTDELVIQARIVATAGNHLVEAKLRFQACDKEVCMPPKTIPVAIDVIAQ